MSPDSILVESLEKTLFGHRRAAGELLNVGIADIAQVIDADFTGKKSVGGQLAQKAEELDSLPQTRILLRVLSIGDQVQNLFLLRRGAIQVRLFIAVDAGIVEPLLFGTKPEFKSPEAVEDEF